MNEIAIASVLGLAGVLVIAAARLGESESGTGAGWGIAAILVSAVLYAWNIILQRQQAQVADPREIALFQTGFVTLILGLAAPWLLVVPPLPVLADIFGSALLTVVSLMLLSWAYARAEAQALIAVEYTAFIWAALLGWLVFSEPVTLATVAGVALILIGCWIAARGPTEQTAL
jgi:S-adenosylmethionine uptake transporter